MSYFPDFRKETDKLNEVDQAYIGGYRHAIENMKCVFDNLDDEDALSIEKEIIGKIKTAIEMYMELEEIELVCALFNEADYLPDDIELVDANKV